jgi:hypothetical protein
VETLFIAMAVFLVAALLNIPMIRKPLSEDDGNWYYLAVFQSTGIRLFKGYENYGYFGIPWMAARIYRLLKCRGLSFFYVFKLVWYSLTAVTVYFMTLCLWQDQLHAAMAAVIFIVIIAVPSTFFVLTYGEHFFILPINLSVVYAHYGLTTGQPWWFLGSGLMAAWALQIKPTALLFGLALPVLFFLNSNVFLALGYYWLAFASLNLLPIPIIRSYGGSPEAYLRATFYPPLELVNYALRRIVRPSS